MMMLPKRYLGYLVFIALPYLGRYFDRQSSHHPLPVPPKYTGEDSLKQTFGVRSKLTVAILVLVRLP